MKTQDLNLFRVGAHVDIENVDGMQNIRIERISESGVTISGSVGQNVVISGKSPATLHQIDVFSQGGNIEAPIEEKRARRGSLIEKMSHIEVPGEVFTIKLLAEYNDVPNSYAAKWVSENCVECGKAEKEEGARGRAAALYKIKS